jgi:AraC-like DNA-binding protein
VELWCLQGEGRIFFTVAEFTRFSTNTFPRSARFPAWQDCLRRYFGEVRATTKDTNPFDAWIESITEQSVVVTRMRAGPQRIEHTESAVVAEHHGFVHVVFPLCGYFHIEQSGRSVVLERGDWGIYDLSRSFRSVSAHPVELLVLAAPRAMVLGRDLEFERIIAQRFSARSGGARVVKNFMTSLLEEQRALSPALRHDFARFALQLTRRTLVEVTTQRSAKNSSRILRARVKSYIADHVRNPDLSIETIATAFQCSKRYIHKLLSSEGLTASQHILQCRLEGCARDLASSELAHLTITDIAVAWGFKSLSTFSRLFRQHFKVSPRTHRVARH